MARFLDPWAFYRQFLSTIDVPWQEVERWRRRAEADYAPPAPPVIDVGRTFFSIPQPQLRTPEALSTFSQALKTIEGAFPAIEPPQFRPQILPQLSSMVQRMVRDVWEAGQKEALLSSQMDMETAKEVLEMMLSASPYPLTEEDKREIRQRLPSLYRIAIRAANTPQQALNQLQELVDMAITAAINRRLTAGGPEVAGAPEAPPAPGALGEGLPETGLPLGRTSLTKEEEAQLKILERKPTAIRDETKKLVASLLRAEKVKEKIDKLPPAEQPEAWGRAASEALQRILAQNPVLAAAWGRLDKEVRDRWLEDAIQGAVRAQYQPRRLPFLPAWLQDIPSFVGDIFRRGPLEAFKRHPDVWVPLGSLALTAAGAGLALVTGGASGAAAAAGRGALTAAGRAMMAARGIGIGAAKIGIDMTAFYTAVDLPPVREGLARTAEKIANTAVPRIIQSSLVLTGKGPTEARRQAQEIWERMDPRAKQGVIMLFDPLNLTITAGLLATHTRLLRAAGRLSERYVPAPLAESAVLQTIKSGWQRLSETAGAYERFRNRLIQSIVERRPSEYVFRRATSEFSFFTQRLMRVEAAEEGRPTITRSLVPGVEDVYVEIGAYSEPLAQHFVSLPDLPRPSIENLAPVATSSWARLLGERLTEGRILRPTLAELVLPERGTLPARAWRMLETPRGEMRVFVPKEIYDYVSAIPEIRPRWVLIRRAPDQWAIAVASDAEIVGVLIPDIDMQSQLVAAARRARYQPNLTVRPWPSEMLREAEREILRPAITREERPPVLEEAPSVTREEPPAEAAPSVVEERPPITVERRPPPEINWQEVPRGRISDALNSIKARVARHLGGKEVEEGMTLLSALPYPEQSIPLTTLLRALRNAADELRGIDPLAAEIADALGLKVARRIVESLKKGKSPGGMKPGAIEATFLVPPPQRPPETFPQRAREAFEIARIPVRWQEGRVVFNGGRLSLGDVIDLGVGIWSKETIPAKGVPDHALAHSGHLTSPQKFVGIERARAFVRALLEFPALDIDDETYRYWLEVLNYLERTPRQNIQVQELVAILEGRNQGWRLTPTEYDSAILARRSRRRERAPQKPPALEQLSQEKISHPESAAAQTTAYDQVELDAIIQPLRERMLAGEIKPTPIASTLVRLAGRERLGGEARNLVARLMERVKAVEGIADDVQARQRMVELLRKEDPITLLGWLEAEGSASIKDFRPQLLPDGRVARVTEGGEIIPIPPDQALIWLEYQKAISQLLDTPAVAARNGIGQTALTELAKSWLRQAQKAARPLRELLEASRTKREGLPPPVGGREMSLETLREEGVTIERAMVEAPSAPLPSPEEALLRVEEALEARKELLKALATSEGQAQALEALVRGNLPEEIRATLSDILQYLQSEGVEVHPGLLERLGLPSAPEQLRTTLERPPAAPTQPPTAIEGPPPVEPPVPEGPPAGVGKPPEPPSLPPPEPPSLPPPEPPTGPAPEGPKSPRRPELQELPFAGRVHNKILIALKEYFDTANPTPVAQALKEAASQLGEKGAQALLAMSDTMLLAHYHRTMEPLLRLASRTPIVHSVLEWAAPLGMHITAPPKRLVAELAARLAQRGVPRKLAEEMAEEDLRRFMGMLAGYEDLREQARSLGTLIGTIINTEMERLGLLTPEARVGGFQHIQLPDGRIVNYEEFFVGLPDKELASILTPEQMQLRTMLKRFFQATGEVLVEHGLLKKEELKKDYFPRLARGPTPFTKQQFQELLEKTREEMAGSVAFGERGFQKARFFETLAEGLKAGVNYETRPGLVVGAWFASVEEAKYAQAIRRLAGELGIPTAAGTTPLSKFLEGRLLPIEVPEYLRFLTTLSGIIVPLRFGLDLGMYTLVTLPGILTLGTLQPKAIAPAIWASLRAFLSPKAYSKHVVENMARYIDHIRFGGTFDLGMELFRTEVATSKVLEAATKMVRTTLSPFERAFTTAQNEIASTLSQELRHIAALMWEGQGATKTLNIFRRLIAQALGPNSARLETLEDVYRAVTNLSERLVGRGTPLLASDINRMVRQGLFLAPRYTWATVSIIASALRANTLSGRAALALLGTITGSTVALYSLAALAAGQEPILNPRDPAFLTLRVGDRHIGVGGALVSLARLLTMAIQEPERLLSGDPVVNPLLRFWYSRANPIAGLIVDLARRRNYSGQPIRTPADVMREIGLLLPPIAVEEAVREMTPAALIEFLGARSYTISPIERLEEARRLAFARLKEEQPSVFGRYRTLEEARHLDPIAMWEIDQQPEVQRWLRQARLWLQERFYDSPLQKLLAEIDRITAETRAQQEADDLALQQGQMTPDRWRERRETRILQRVARLEEARRILGVTGQKAVYPSGSMAAALALYYSIRPDQYVLPDGSIDWAAWQEARESVLKELSPEDRARFIAYTQRHLTETERAYQRDLELLRSYWALSDQIWDTLRERYPTLRNVRNARELSSLYTLARRGEIQDPTLRETILNAYQTYRRISQRALEAFRLSHPNVYQALWRWGYVEKPLTEALQEAR